MVQLHVAIVLGSSLLGMFRCIRLSVILAGVCWVKRCVELSSPVFPKSNYFRYDLCQHLILISLCCIEPETRAKSCVECHDDIHDFDEDSPMDDQQCGRTGGTRIILRLVPSYTTMVFFIDLRWMNGLFRKIAFTRRLPPLNCVDSFPPCNGLMQSSMEFELTKLSAPMVISRGFLDFLPS